jgi:hypothetical protein
MTARAMLRLVDAGVSNEPHRGRPRPANETESVLRALTVRAAKGRLPMGIALYFHDEHGDEQVVITGGYKESHAQAVKAAARMMWRLMQAEDDPAQNRWS